MRYQRYWTTMAVIMLLSLLLVLASCQVPAAAPQADTATDAETAADEEAVDNLFLMVDMVQGSKNIPEDERSQKSCVLTSRFPRNSEIVWRARVFDPQAGETMDDEALDTVEVQLANGETLGMRYAPHPRDDPDAESYWTASWVIPEEHATGTLNYTIVAESTDGRSGEFEPFDVDSSLLTVTDDVLETIEEE